MDLRALKTFEACVRLGHFHKAAEELQYAPSTITLQIQRLEADLGVSLFVRESKRVFVTEAGRWLYHEASALLKSIGSMRQTVFEIATGDVGTVYFAAVEPVASQKLASVVAGFCKTRPGVEFTMEVGGSKSIGERVRSGELDFGVCAAPPASLNLEFEPLMKETLGVMMRTDHPLSGHSHISVEDLAGQSVLVKEPSCIYREIWERTLNDSGSQAFPCIEVGSFCVIQQMVKAGLGVGVVPIYSGLEAEGSLVIRPFNGLNPEVAIGIVYKNLGFLGKASLLLLNAIRHNFESRR